MSQADVLSHIGEPTADCGQPFSACVYAEGRGAAWVSAVGELDLISAPGFAWTLSRALDRALLLVVDLRELTFIDAAGIGVIVQADAVARRTGHRIVFVNGTGSVDRLFALLGLDERLRIVDLTELDAASASGCEPLPIAGARHHTTATATAPRRRRATGG